jgi:protein TonB
MHGEMPQETHAAHRPAAGRHLIVMTRDPALIHALQELAGDELTILLVEDLRRLGDELVQHATAVALLDAQALGVSADAAVDAVKNQFPEVRLMVAGHAAEQNLLATRISDQRVFRFVHKPASPQRLRLFLEAASLQAAPAHSAPAVAAEEGAGGTAGPPRGGISMLPMIAGTAAVIILATGGWMLVRKSGDAKEGQAVVEQPAAAPELTALLALADAALARGLLVAADGSSAAELYREALRVDPASAMATAGFDRSIENALAGAEQALLAGNLDLARNTAELVRLIVPDNSRLAFLNTQIERELARVNADATQRQALQMKEAQIRAAVASVQQQILKGALLEPVTDNAVSRFRAAQLIGGGDPLVRTSRDSLVGALLTAADKELDAGNGPLARRLVEAAGSVNSSAPGLDIMRRRVDEATGRQRAASTAEPAPAAPAPAPSAPAPALAAPAPVADSTTSPAAVGTTPAPAAAPAAAQDTRNSVVSASTLKALRRAEPEFPAQALEKLQSGWVEMEFTVARDGTVQDVSITASEPRRTFDSAALSAMRRWRFAPVLRDGQPVEQRATMRMRFTAQDSR